MQIYLVGGAVRDQLLGIDSADRDFVVVGATPELMLSSGYHQVGHDFPVFLHPDTHEEYALARTEKKEGYGYLGFSCDFNEHITLEEDLKRRDLTINAMAMDAKGKIIDPYHGQDDLRHKILRHVSDAFVEDPLRVLRVARFYARFHHLGFKIAPETLELMRFISESGELEALTSERVFQELNKALMTKSPHKFILALRQVGALKEVLPELDKLFGVPGPKRWHPEIDSGIHTCMTLERIARENDNPIVRFAMLCHDLGKGETPVMLWPCHKLHDALGQKPLKCMCQRLKVPREYEDFASVVVLNHSTMHHLYRNGAEGIVKLFNAIDAFRKPNRVKPFAQCCKCDFLGRKGFEERPFPRMEYFLEMFEICNSVKAGEFVEQGFTGLQIKEEVFKRRVNLIEEYFRSIPANELNDADNEEQPELPPAKCYPLRKPQNQNSIQFRK